MLKRQYVNLAFFLPAMSLPMSVPIIRNALILLALILLIHFFLEKNTDLIKNDGVLAALTISFFMLLVLSIIIHPPISFSPMESRWPFFILPLLLFFTKVEIDDGIKKNTMKGFVIGNYIVIAFNFGRAIYNSTHIEQGKISFDSTVWGNIPVWESIDHVGNYFFSTYLSGFIHPTYWALFLTMAIVFIWLHNPLNSNLWFRMGSIVLFLIFIFLCSSRAGIIGSLLTVLLLIFMKLSVFQSFYARVAILSSLFVVILFMLLNPRMTDFIKTFQEQTIYQSLRVSAWGSAVAVIEQNPVTGVGLQNAEREMLKQYQQRGLEQHYDLALNAHNQYLETMLSTGLPGLVILVVILIVLFKRSRAQKDLLLFLFALNIALHFCFESMLNRFHGIVFFTFFALILFAGKVSEKQTARL